MRRIRAEQTESLEVRQLLTGTFEWANTQGQLADGVETDASGHVYTLGNFSGTVDFDSGPGVFELTSAGPSDIFITKVDVNGVFQWARCIRDTAGGNDGAKGIALDSAGNIHITGAFSGVVDFDPGSSVANLTSAGSVDVFVLKLDSNGNYVWARRLGGSLHELSADIAVDSAGGVVTTGWFLGTSDFNPGAEINNLTSAGNNADLFVSKLDSSGNYVWAHRVGGTGFDEGFGVAVDAAGNVFATGLYKGTVDFNPGAEVNNLPGEAFIQSTFILKLDSNGDYVWARRTGGNGFSCQPSDIAVDSNGNVLTTGYFSGTIDFNPGAGVNNLATAGKRDVFVSKLDNAGDYVWARKMGGSLDDEPESIAVDSAGNVFTTGQFRSISDFDPGAGVFNLTSAGKTDTFVSKLDSNGNFAWARRIGGTEEDKGNAISVDSSKNIAIVGSFLGTVDFDPGAGVSSRTSQGGADGFTLKLTPDMYFDLSGRSGDVKLVRNGNNVDLFFNGTMTAGLYLLMDQQPISEIRSVRIRDMQGLANSLTLDFQSGGVFSFAGGIHFAAGSGNSDRIRILGVAGQSASIRQPSASNGLNQLLIDNEPINFSGTEGAVITGVTTLLIEPPKSDDVLILNPGTGINGAVASRLTGTSGGVNLLPLTFHDVRNVNIKTGTNDSSDSGGNDLVSINQGGLKALGLQNLTIDTGIGKDRLILNATNLQLGAAGGAFRYLGGSETNVLEVLGNTDWTLTSTKLTAGGGGVLQLKSVQSSILTGGNSNNILNAALFDGTVTLNGLGGNDFLYAAMRSSILNGGDGNDYLFAGLSSDSLNCGTGADQIFLRGTNSADHLTLQRTSTGSIYRRRLKAAGSLQETDTITSGGSLEITIKAFDGDDLIAVDSLFSHRGTVDGGLGTDTCTAPRIWKRISC